MAPSVPPNNPASAPFRTSAEISWQLLVRVEQLYPFAASAAIDILARYPLTADLVWAQEEPRNMGPWRFMRDQLQPLADTTSRTIRYVGRPDSAGPATGSGKRHQQERPPSSKTL